MFALMNSKKKTMKSTDMTSIRCDLPVRIPVRVLSGFALAFLTFAVSGRAADLTLAAPPLPSPLCDSVNVPAGNRMSLHTYAIGVQIYRWSGTNWAFIGPEAVLFADQCYQEKVGIHYSGPIWETKDGSKVVGTRVADCTPDRGAI